MAESAVDRNRPKTSEERVRRALEGGGQSFGPRTAPTGGGGGAGVPGVTPGSGSAADQLAAIGDQVVAGGGAGALNAYGLESPADYQAGGDFPLSRSMTGVPDSMRYPNQGPNEPYYQGSAQTLLRGMPAEERARLQELMVAVGLTNRVIPGEMDDGTVAGFERLLGMSNRRGERWQSSILRLQRGLDSGEIPRVGSLNPEDAPRDPFRFVEQEYLPPDPDEVRNSIRDIAKQIVPDIDLDDEEVDFLRSQFEQFGAQQFEAAEHQRRHDEEASYEAGAPVAEGSTDPVVATSEAVQQVSAADKFRAFFEERYAPNIQRREDQEQEIGRRKVTDANLSALLSFATGRA